MSTKAQINFHTLHIEFKDTLKTALKKNNHDLLEAKVNTFKRTDADLKAPFDQAFRDVLLDLLADEVEVQQLKSFVQLSIDCTRKYLITSTVPVVLLGDIFDTLTLDVCEEMFTFVEDNVDVWKEELYFSPCKNHLLRLCNDLLRRLSRTTATVFCGKILLFLAKFFPFSERSGLNIVSEFNLENVTEYGNDAADDAVSEVTLGDQKHVIDFSFYCKFWQLQDFFRNPNQCYDKHSMNILNTFQGIKLDYITSSEDNVGYFAKYLTSQKLLDLQLNDVSFRRSVLLQFLITFQYLTSAVKFKPESYDLKMDQKEWIQNSSDKVYSLLKETPPDGEKFSNIIKNILKREELWNLWKNDGCPDIKKFLPQNEPFDIPKPKRSQPLVGDLVREASRDGKYYLGNPDLTKLWNICPNNLDVCKDRNFLPTLEEYFADALAQIESGTPIKEEDNLLNDSNFGWRALRLLAKKSPYFFSIHSNPHTLPKYLEVMVNKLANEKPGPNDENSQETPNEQEIDENLLTEEQGTEEFKQSDEYTEETSRIESKTISEDTLLVIVEKVAPDWEKLGTKLGYKTDEIEWFKNESPERLDQAKHMMKLWFEDDEDANLDNLLYILEGLEMNEAAESVRNVLNSSKDG